MTGPERFARAVELLEQSRREGHAETATMWREEAMIEASLAAAAATIDAARMTMLAATPVKGAASVINTIRARWERVTGDPATK